MAINTKHKQVQFITLDGRATLVDEGMLAVLNELRRLGVRTQYSCQKDRKTAYVLGDRKSFQPALKKIRQAYKDGLLSEDSARAVRCFLRGYTVHEFSWFKVHPDGAYETRFERSISTGHPSMGPRWSLQYLYSNKFGLRVVVRWPHNRTPAVLAMLKEIDPIKELGSMEALPGINWEENRLSECTYGCKVYRQKGTGLEYVAHNSSYGCPK